MGSFGYTSVSSTNPLGPHTTRIFMEKADDICVYIATYAKTWKLLGKMTAEEPPSDDANGH